MVLDVGGLNRRPESRPHPRPTLSPPSHSLAALLIATALTPHTTHTHTHTHTYTLPACARTKVTRIEYNCSGAHVLTKDGRTFNAREVISTLPLGVLKQKHATLFDPPLPSDQAATLSWDSKFVMGNLTHVVIQFPTVWWDNNLTKWLSANQGSNESAAGGTDGGGDNAAGEFSLWHNLNHDKFLPRSQTLLTFLGDPQSSRYEALPSAVVQHAVVERLRKQHPRASIPEPTDFFISRHGFDTKSYGAYSISLAGWKDTQHTQMTQPIKVKPTGPRWGLDWAWTKHMNAYFYFISH